MPVHFESWMESRFHLTHYRMFFFDDVIFSPFSRTLSPFPSYLRIIVYFTLRSLGTSTLFDILWVCVYFPCWWFSFLAWVSVCECVCFFFFLTLLLSRLFACRLFVEFLCEVFLTSGPVIEHTLAKVSCKNFISVVSTQRCNNFTISKSIWDSNYNRPPFFFFLLCVQSIYGFLRSLIDARKKKYLCKWNSWVCFVACETLHTL